MHFLILIFKLLYPFIISPYVPLIDKFWKGFMHLKSLRLYSLKCEKSIESFNLSHLSISISFSKYIIWLFPFLSRFLTYSLKTTEKSTIFGFNSSGLPLLSARPNNIGIFVKLIEAFGFWNSFEIIANVFLLIIPISLTMK